MGLFVRTPYKEEVVESDGMAMNGVLTQHLPESSTAQSRKRKLSDGDLEETTTTKSRNKLLMTDGTMQLSQQQAVDQASTSSNQALPHSTPPPNSPPPPMEKQTSFQLFKIVESSEEYILEQTMFIKVETCEVNRYRFFTTYKTVEGYWKGKKSKAPNTLPPLSMVVKDSYPSIFIPDCEVPFQDRLQGWTFQKTTRPSGFTDTFYFHMGERFRSLVEVAEYIVYSSYTKLVPIQRLYRSQEGLEAEAAAVTMMMVFDEVTHYENSNTRCLTILAETAAAISNQVEIESSLSIVDGSSESPLFEVTIRVEAVPSTSQSVIEAESLLPIVDGSSGSPLFEVHIIEEAVPSTSQLVGDGSLVSSTSQPDLHAISGEIEEGSSQPIVDDDRSALEANQAEKAVPSITAQPAVACYIDESIFSDLFEIEDLSSFD